MSLQESCRTFVELLHAARLSAISVKGTDDANQKENAWKGLRDGKYKVVVATDSFGVGMNVPATWRPWWSRRSAISDCMLFRAKRCVSVGMAHFEKKTYPMKRLKHCKLIISK